jgi:cytoskeletal protein CcmA (bactofilin family)
MIFRRRQAPAGPPELVPPFSPSFLPAGARLRGNLTGIDDLAVSGRLAGNVIARGQVTIGAGAEVEGSVAGRVVVVKGSVKGPVRGEERIELLAGGSVEGDLASPHVVVADGAKLHGKVDVLK